MFLPVLLVRDYGTAAWFVFAVPNVVGAAAMGWVLARPGSGERVAVAHRGAGVCFSIVTICFHAFFVDWVIRGLAGLPGLALAPAAAVVFWVIGRRGRGDLVTAAVVFVLSVAAFVTFAVLDRRGPQVVASTAPAARHLLPLAAVCVFGFALCPYLDLTFLRARRSTAPRAGVVAFAVGFGVMFLLMIVFTFWYAGPLRAGSWAALPRAVAWALAGHMILQTGFTVAVHWRELASRWVVPDRATQAGTLAGLVCGAVPLTAGALDLNPVARFADPNELIYRLFMAYYGLVFPAYVWLCMIPRRNGVSQPPNPRSLIVLAVAVAIAAPMYWLAFVEGRMPWVVPAIAVVLLARLVPVRTTSTLTP